MMIRKHTELEVYKKAFAAAMVIFQASQNFPRDEMYSLTDQMRRAVRSIGAQIAEAWGKRRYEKHFVSKLTDADAEQMETQHWIGDAWDCGYISNADATRLNSGLEEIGRMLNSMMAKADSFCGSPDNLLREPAPEYFTAAPTDN